MQPKKQPTVIEVFSTCPHEFYGGGCTFIERHDQTHHGRARVIEGVDKGWLVDQAAHDSIVISCNG